MRKTKIFGGKKNKMIATLIEEDKELYE